jgi:thiamine-monophosphate kinase
MQRSQGKNGARKASTQGFEEALVGKLKGASTARNGFRPARSRARLQVGIGDDAALWSPRPGHQTLLTCDWFLEGVHFLRGKHPPDAVGWKCLARAASDIAAMGGEPRCCLLSLALPRSATGQWLDLFLSGLRRAQARLKCALAGGDTTRSERILINVTVLGEVPNGGAVLRSGARPGDAVFVSGRLGEAQLGLHLLREAPHVSRRDAVIRKHLYPEPRLALGAWLARTKLATAMMDLSDGLSSDLRRLCEASGVGARIEAAKLPVVRREDLGREEALRLALDGGEDYELLFTVARKSCHRVPKRLAGLRLSAVGVITSEPQLSLAVARPGKGLADREARERARPLMPAGWDPFSS